MEIVGGIIVVTDHRNLAISLSSGNSAMPQDQVVIKYGAPGIVLFLDMLGGAFYMIIKSLLDSS